MHINVELDTWNEPEDSISKITSEKITLVEEVIDGLLFTGMMTFDQSSFNSTLKEKDIA